MKKSFKRFLTGALAFMMCFSCFSMTGFASTEAYTEVRQMGQVTMNFYRLYAGVDSFSYYINLNGYVPKKITTTISGNFTEEELRAAIDRNSTMDNTLRITLTLKPEMHSVAVTNDQDRLDAVNGLLGESYYHNTYESDRSLTSVEYSFLPPGDKPWNGISVHGGAIPVSLSFDGSYLPTTFKVYMDDQLFLEYTGVITSGVRVQSYKIHNANFQMSQESQNGYQVTAEPTTSNIYVDGQQAAANAYFINGSNYMKLSDIAYMLKGTDAKFNIKRHQDRNLTELLPGETYTGQSSESAGLSAATASVSREQVTSKITAVFNKIYQVDFQPAVYQINGDIFYELRDVAHMAGFTADWDAAANSVYITTTK